MNDPERPVGPISLIMAAFVLVVLGVARIAY